MDIEVELRVNAFSKAMEELAQRYFPNDEGLAFVCGLVTGGMEQGEHALLSSLDQGATVYALRTMKDDAENRLIQHLVAHARERATVAVLARFANDETAYPAGTLEHEISRLTKEWLSEEKPEGYEEAIWTRRLQELVDQLHIEYRVVEVVESDDILDHTDN